MTENQYTLTIDIATIDSLGKNLYSNAAAVLSEFVANAWDADANHVKIEYLPDDDCISIVDDGRGMSADELNSRFLTVGYRKRNIEGDKSQRFNRQYMGRKGIGKLSAFSLAEKMSVSSKTQGNSAQGFIIDVKEMEKKISVSNPSDRQYHPRPLNPGELDFADVEHGTKIVLSELRTKRVGLTLGALRRRLARRFDVLNLASLEDESGGFTISINGDIVTYADRGDLQKLEHIWYLGDYSLPDDVKIEAQEHRIETVSIQNHPDWKLSGWIGSVLKPADRVFNDDDESMKNIIVLARKRPIQEGLLDHLAFDKHFSSYVTGQIQADFLDQNDKEDIATSDRQRLVEDDERVRAFNQKMLEILNDASDIWSKCRSEKASKQLYESVPAVKEWIDSLSVNYKSAARKMIDRVSSIPDVSSDDRKSLYQASIAAFNKIQKNNDIDRLANIETVDEVQLLSIFNSYIDFETLEYAEIVKTRLAIIDKFEALLDANALENTTRDFVAENPWLLDPSWERATRELIKEKSFKRIAHEEFGISFDDDESANDRVDIKYLSSGEAQVIVEFKRYDRKIYLNEIRDQIHRYALAMTNMLERNDQNKGLPPAQKNASGIDERVNIRIIVKEVFDDVQRMRLNPIAANDQVRSYRARFLYFSDMVQQSKEKYREFINTAGGQDLASNAIRALR